MVQGGGGGGGVDGTPSSVFLICCSILKRLYFKWKAFDLPNKMRYISRVVVPLEACGVANDLSNVLRNQAETARNGNFFVLKGAVSRNSAKLGNYKMPVKLR